MPNLERNYELARRYVDCFDGYDCPYDVLLDDYEPGMKTTEVASLFSALKSELTPMIAAITAHADRVDDSVLHGSFPIEQPARLVAEVIQRMGFDRAAWRIDDAVHPFASGLRISGREDHDALGGVVLRLVALRVDARMRARAVRGRGRQGAAAHAARVRRVTGAARVPEPHVGEHGRPQPAVLRRARADGLAHLRRPSADAGPRHAVPGGQQDLAFVHPRRGRRGYLRPAHRAALRARAGADRRPARGRRPAGGVERAVQGVPRVSTFPTTRMECSRTCTGRAAWSVTSRRTRWAT